LPYGRGRAYDTDMTTTGHITTAEQLLQAPGLGRCELIRGEVVMMTPAGFRPGRIGGKVAAALVTYVEPRRLGVVITAEGGFQIAHDPDTVRAPDVAFVRAERLPAAEPLGFFQGAPDLAVEVLSPGDRASEVTAKVQDWLDAGSSVVWVVDPQTNTVSVYQGRGEATILRSGDALTGGELIPGLRIAVAELFAT